MVERKKIKIKIKKRIFHGDEVEEVKGEETAKCSESEVGEGYGGVVQDSGVLGVSGVGDSRGVEVTRREEKSEGFRKPWREREFRRGFREIRGREAGERLDRRVAGSRGELQESVREQVEKRQGGYKRFGIKDGFRPPSYHGTRKSRQGSSVFAQTGKQVSRRNRKDTFGPETVEVAEESFESKLDAEFLRRPKEKVYAIPEKVEIYDVITVGELARKMNIKASELINVLEKLGLSVTITDKIDADTATVVAEEFGAKVIVKSVFDEINVPEEPDDDRYIRERVPVVTVMGHVDHGKTTLLDAIRNTRVAQTESGGITQHIGASVVEVGGKKITFIDTPGHEAFAFMRAKGAKVTDIVVLVVAADDGVKEQTLEALNHARDAKVPIIVAINKIDSPGANPERVKNQLSELGLIPDDWGGDTMYVELSALKKINIDKLLEAILLQAEMMELKADHHKRGVGFIIESRVDQGRGIVFTVIVKNGVIRVGDNFVVGATSGKVRAIFDDRGQKITEILPGLPGEVVGADELPNPGDRLDVVDSEDMAREIAEKRKHYLRVENIKSLKKGADLFKETKEVKYIVKGDVFGSVEAIKYSIEGLSDDEVSVKVIHWGVGQVSESDVMLASAGGASIIAFRTKVGPRAAEIAEREKVKIKKYSVIYEVIEDVKNEMKGLKEPVLSEKVLGLAEVRKVFKISGIGNVAGCYVRNGVIQRKAKVRIYRDNVLVFDGEILSLRHFKDDVSEVREGFECGIAFKGFDDVREGDVVECYVLSEQSL